VVKADLNVGDVHTFVFQQSYPWLSNVGGVVSVNPTLADAYGTYPLVLRITDSNSAGDASVLFYDANFSIVIK